MTYEAELNRNARSTSRYSLCRSAAGGPVPGSAGRARGPPSMTRPASRYGQKRGPLSYQLLDDGDSPALPPLSCDLWDVKSKTMTERQQRTPVVFDIVCLVILFLMQTSRTGFTTSKKVRRDSWEPKFADINNCSVDLAQQELIHIFKIRHIPHVLIEAWIGPYTAFTARLIRFF